MSQQYLIELRTALVELYPDDASIRRVAADAGIHSSRIAFTAIAVNAWHSLLTEAEKVGRVNVLLGVVENEYRDNKEFREACAAYRQAADKSSRPNLDAQITVKDTVAPKRWFALFFALLLMGIAGGGWYWGMFNAGRQIGGEPATTITVLNSATPERQVEVVATPSPPIPTETFTPVPTMLATKSVTTATPTQPQATDTSTPADTPTLSSTLSSTLILQPTTTATATPTPIPTSGPCTATIKSTTGSTTVSLRETATGKALNFSIPVNETVLILSPSSDKTAYKISYTDSGREILGWLPTDNLHFADCPK